MGRAITIPAVLFESGAPGSDSLVTPVQANAVAAEMWKLWEAAEVENDTRALTQLAAPGPMLAGTINDCASPGVGCTYETKARTATDLQTIIPLQRSYPIYFLMEAQTTGYVAAASNGLATVEPWVDLKIVTKSSQAAQWKLSFETGYDGVNGAVPSFLPTFDNPQGAAGDDYNQVVNQTPTVPATQFLPKLATYWQSYKDTGRPPARNPFVKNGYTSGVGHQLAEDRQGSVYLGHRLNFAFSADAAAGSWEFSVGGGYPMVCGAIVDRATFTPLSGLLFQNADESNWGVPLAPGDYRQISSYTDRDTCVFIVKGGLDVAGDDIYRFAVTGERDKGAAPKLKNPTLADLETQFGILAAQLQTYVKQYRQCTRTEDSCTESLAARAQLEFAKFSNELLNDVFPARAKDEGAKLSATARALTILFMQLRSAPTDDAILAKVAKDEPLLARQFKALVSALSKP